MSLHTCLKKAIAEYVHMASRVCAYDATYILCLQCIIGMSVCKTDYGGASVLDPLLVQRINITTQQTKKRTIVSTISFTSPKLKDSGYYVCLASNPVDQESQEVVFDVYPIGSNFVDKGFENDTADVNVVTEADEDDVSLCEGGTCGDMVLFDIGVGEETGDIVSRSGVIVLAVAISVGLLTAAMVLAIAILLTRRCLQK